MADIKHGSSVGFKLGSQSNLDALLAKGTSAGAINGCFYLTKDTHRLYIGNEDTSLSPVNQGVLIVDKISASANDEEGTTYLPAAASAGTEGNFYYVKDGNILCVSSGGKWVQINTIRDLQTVSTTISDNDAENEVEITTTIKVGTTEKSDSFKIDGGDNVTVTQADNKITIASSYTDTNNVATELNISAATDENATGFDVSIGRTLYVNGVEQDAIDSLEANLDPSISVGTTTDTKETVKFVDGNASLPVYSKAEIDSKMLAINAMTYRGTIGDDSQTANSVTLDTEGNVKSVIKTIPAEGEQEASTVTVPVSIGDTFLVENDITIDDEKTIKANTLLIARSSDNSEQEDGTIAADKLIFDAVASTADQDHKYSLTADNANNTIRLASSIAGEDADTIKIVGGTVDNSASVTAAQTGENGDYVVTLTHDSVTRTDSKVETAEEYDVSTGATVTVVSGVTTDATGHITAVTTKDVKLGKIEVTNTYAAATATEDGVTTATVTDTTKVANIVGEEVKADMEKTSTFGIASSSLQLSASGSVVTADLVWESFDPTPEVD